VIKDEVLGTGYDRDMSGQLSTVSSVEQISATYMNTFLLRNEQ